MEPDNAETEPDNAEMEPDTVEPNPATKIWSLTRAKWTRPPKYGT